MARGLGSDNHPSAEAQNATKDKHIMRLDQEMTPVDIKVCLKNLAVQIDQLTSTKTKLLARKQRLEEELAFVEKLLDTNGTEAKIAATL